MRLRWELFSQFACSRCLPPVFPLSSTPLCSPFAAHIRCWSHISSFRCYIYVESQEGCTSTGKHTQLEFRTPRGAEPSDVFAPSLAFTAEKHQGESRIRAGLRWLESPSTQKVPVRLPSVKHITQHFRGRRASTYSL
jgi:hypothetical protein